MNVRFGQSGDSLPTLPIPQPGSITFASINMQSGDGEPLVPIDPCSICGEVITDGRIAFGKAGIQHLDCAYPPTADPDPCTEHPCAKHGGCHCGCVCGMDRDDCDECAEDEQ